MEKGTGRGAGWEAGPRRQLVETGSWAGTVGRAGRDLVQEAGLKRGQLGTGRGGKQRGRSAGDARVGPDPPPPPPPPAEGRAKTIFLVFVGKDSAALGLAQRGLCLSIFVVVWGGGFCGLEFAAIPL